MAQKPPAVAALKELRIPSRCAERLEQRVRTVGGGLFLSPTACRRRRCHRDGARRRGSAVPGGSIKTRVPNRLCICRQQKCAQLGPAFGSALTPSLRLALAPFPLSPLGLLLPRLRQNSLLRPRRYVWRRPRAPLNIQPARGAHPAQRVPVLNHNEARLLLLLGGGMQLALSLSHACVSVDHLSRCRIN